MNITVVGLGKIGLPLAVQFAQMGHHVLGADVNFSTVEFVNSGAVPFPGEDELENLLASSVSSGALRATTDTTAAVQTSEVVVVVVPLFVNEQGIPDFAWMDSATEAIGQGLQPGTLVSYETTLPVGTTRSRFAKALESISGLKLEEDFFVAFSPERVRTGRVFEDLKKYPKLVGGVGPRSAEKAIAFYEAVIDFDERADLARNNGVWDLGSAEASEMAKLAETTYRDVNIALANQFALFAEKSGVDIYSVIDACNSQFYSHIHQPGIAVGGHCIPIYPQMYLWNDPEATVVRSARAANKQMPRHAVDHLSALLDQSLQGLRVAILGASYRTGVKETAFSGVFDVADALRDLGAIPVVHDPLYSDEELRKLGFEPFHFGESVIAAIIQTDHAEYRNLKNSDLPGVRAVIDGRNVLNASELKDVSVRTIGRSNSS
jgi:nucleotide sugar dehydrogenase